MPQASERLAGDAHIALRALSEVGSFAISAQSSHERSASPASRPLRTVRFADDSNGDECQSERHDLNTDAASAGAYAGHSLRSAGWTPRSLHRCAAQHAAAKMQRHSIWLDALMASIL